MSKPTKERASSALIQKTPALEPPANSSVFLPARWPQRSSPARRPRRGEPRAWRRHGREATWVVRFSPYQWATQHVSRSREPSAYRLVFSDIPVCAKTIITDILVCVKILPWEIFLNRTTTLKKAIIIPHFRDDHNGGGENSCPRRTASRLQESEPGCDRLPRVLANGRHVSILYHCLCE